MNKACASILVFIALFALVGAEDFMRIHLDQGVLRMRNLATATTPKYSFDNYTNSTGVAVNMSAAYMTAIGKDPASPTDMALFLYTNVTGFCGNCQEFEKFDCTKYACNYDTNAATTMLSPNYVITNGYPFNFSNLTIGNDTSAWKLNSLALYHSGYSSDYSIPYVTKTNGYGFYYIRNSTNPPYSALYGYLGLGVGGNATKNFQSATPIFSVQVNDSGVGSLIFGKDTTLYDSTRTPISLTTDTNWTTISKNISFGNNINNTNYISNVIFDLQYPGLGLPSTYFTTIWNLLVSNYSLTPDTSHGSTEYYYVFKGNLSSLPALNIGLTNGKNITIPPSGYTKQLDTNLFVLLLGSVGSVNNKTSGQSVNYTILGWPVLSQFYTVFELPTTNIPTVTMYPTYNATANGMIVTTTPSSSSFSMKTLAIIAAIVLIVLVALSAVCRKKQDFTKSDLGVELRAARV